MNSTALILLTGSVFLHAFWNVICKSRSPHFNFFLMYSSAIAVTVFPFALYTGIPFSAIPGKVVLFAFGGAVFGVLGNVGLTYAYRNCDISTAYPMSRAIPVILTALVTSCFGFGKPITPMAGAGMAVITAGCFLMALAGKKSDFSFFRNRGFIGILIVAFAATGYTITDSFGIRLLGATAGKEAPFSGAPLYQFIRECFAFPGMLLASCLYAKERAMLTKESFRQIQPYVAGAFAGLAYLLVLWAMNYVSNVSYVQAFRQLSIPVGSLLGFLILKEKADLKKVIAILLILLGLTAVYLN